MSRKRKIIQQNLKGQKIANPASSGRAKILLLTLLGLVVFLGTTQIVFSSQVATTGEKIKTLEIEKAELILNTNRLQNEINQISSLSYIEKRARGNLEMIDGTEYVEYIAESEYLASLK